MQPNQLPSKLLEKAVFEVSKLPGIGNRTALRLVLHLLKQSHEDVFSLTEAINELKNHIKTCKICKNISDSDICDICDNPNREGQTVCVVETVRDVMSIENTHQYKGKYHVLGGVISPMDGIGPADLTIAHLENRLTKENISEVILALSATMEGDTTNFYIYKKIKDFNLTVTTLSRGISVGGEIEYADEITLGKSIVNRTPFDASF